MKWPFRRKDNQTSVPAEIQEYYQSERRERTGIAWLLALGTLLVTVALAILLFFAGRWIYRKVANNDDNKSGQTTQQAVQDQKDQAKQDDDKQTNGTGSETASPDTSTSTPDTNGGGTATAPATPPATPNTTPATGSALPDTGPGDLIGPVAVTTVVAATAHNIVSRRRSQS